jgi:hypothetical protein
MTAPARTLPLFDDADLDPATLPRPGTLAPPPPPPTTTHRRPSRVAQMALPIKHHLPVVQPDLHAATGGVCLVQQDECSEEDCRHHLGAVREHLGEKWGCALAVATAFSAHGLAPVHVARLLGLPEGEVQEAEHRALRWLRLEVARLAAEEEEDARRAAARERMRRAAG